MLNFLRLVSFAARMQQEDTVSLDDFLDWILSNNRIELVDKYSLANSQYGKGCSLEVHSQEIGSGLEQSHMSKKINGFSGLMQADVLDKSGKCIGYVERISPSVNMKYLEEMSKLRRAPDIDKMYTHDIAYAFST
jgi:hypothetical protein